MLLSTVLVVLIFELKSLNFLGELPGNYLKKQEDLAVKSIPFVLK